MDFPKTVPGAGLVGGVFADENPATGQPGSLMAAAWGNAVTHELLNVIRAAGLEPKEGEVDQVLKAIQALVPERSVFARLTGSVSLPAGAFGIYALADGGVAATVTLPSVGNLVSDTELLLFANHANTAAVQIKAVAGQVVQGPAGLMNGSTTAFVLPAGGDWVRLRSEKAQGRWVVAGAYPAGVMAQVLLLQGRATALEAQVPLLQGRVAALEVPRKITLYPGGTEAAPATIGVGATIDVPNPFLGRDVMVEVQILIGTEWGAPGWVDGPSSPVSSYGVVCSQINGTGKLVVRSGTNAVATTPALSGSPLPIVANIPSAQYRLRVYRID